MKKVVFTIVSLVLFYFATLGQSDIEVFFGSYKNGTLIDAGKANKVNSIIVKSNKYKDSITITKYDFVYQPLRGTPIMKRGIGGKVTKEMKALISKPKYGEKIMIMNVFVKIPGLGEKRLEKGIIITIKMMDVADDL